MVPFKQFFNCSFIRIEQSSKVYFSDLLYLWQFLVQRQTVIFFLLLNYYLFYYFIIDRVFGSYQQLQLCEAVYGLKLITVNQPGEVLSSNEFSSTLSWPWSELGWPSVLPLWSLWLPGDLQFMSSGLSSLTLCTQTHGDVRAICLLKY